MTSEVMTHVGALVEAHLRSDGPIADRLVGLASEAAARIAENHAIARDLVLELVRTEARPEDPSPYLAEVHAPVRAVLADGQRRGEVRSDLDAGFLAEMVVGALNAAVTQWLSDPHYPIEERLPRAAAFVWDAVRARPAED
jgi:hypothetical protein